MDDPDRSPSDPPPPGEEVSDHDFDRALGEADDGDGDEDSEGLRDVGLDPDEALGPG